MQTLMEKQAEHIQLFIAYTLEDKKYLDELQRYLSPLERKENIHISYDGQISPQQKWTEQVEMELAKADIILLLVSVHLLTTEPFYTPKMKNAFKRHREGQAVVIPIIVSDCAWKQTDLKDLQILPKEHPINYYWSNELLKAKHYTTIVEEIANSIQVLKKQGKQTRKKSMPTTPSAPLSKETVIKNILENMVHVEGGRFLRSSPAHPQNGKKKTKGKALLEVSLNNFQISKYLVTQAQWRVIMEKDPENLRFKACDLCPVEGVSWQQVQAFLKKLNQLTQKSFRLPTEAEWEYAARGGKQSKGTKYAGSHVIDEVGWHDGNSDGKTHPVGQKKANELGLYDMSGNVWEWCQDWYAENYSPDSPMDNPKGPQSGSYRVLRGGSWYFFGLHSDVIYRHYSDPNDGYSDIGFRLALTSSSSPSIESASSSKDVAKKVTINSPSPPKDLTQRVELAVNSPSIIEAILENMVRVEGGSFRMGCTSDLNDCRSNEKPVHGVRLDSYKISKYQVTQEQWRTVMGTDPKELYFKGCDQCPVEKVNWHDAQVFLKKLNQLTQRNFRLPTEAEWEYAARGGKQSKGHKYAGSNAIDEVGWHDGNSDGETHPVGQKKANELGLYDMSGNVWEWCQDWYASDYYKNSPSKNPQGPKERTSRVLRGGSWLDLTDLTRVAYRDYCDPTVRFNNVGFRLAE